MSVQLTIDEMLEAMENGAADLNAIFQPLAEKLATTMGEALAARFDIVAGEGTMEAGFGGLCVPFNPQYLEQPMPECMEGLDGGGDEEWKAALAMLVEEGAGPMPVAAPNALVAASQALLSALEIMPGDENGEVTAYFGAERDALETAIEAQLEGEES